MQEENKEKKSFMQGMKAELKKVIWPTRSQTAKSTAVTIAFVLLISVTLIILNLCFDFISESWYNLILGKNKVDNPKQNNTTLVSGDVSGELNSGEETTSGENMENSVESITSGESNTSGESDGSGESNSVAE